MKLLITTRTQVIIETEEPLYSHRVVEHDHRVEPVSSFKHRKPKEGQLIGVWGDGVPSYGRYAAGDRDDRPHTVRDDFNEVIAEYDDSYLWWSHRWLVEVTTYAQ